jgi:O-antigen ligase
MMRPLHILMASPSVLFLVTLTIFLFRPPDLEFHSIDRIAFGILVATLVTRALLLRERVLAPMRVFWPMLALAALALWDLINQPFEVQIWSAVAAKFIVPYTLFCLASTVFSDLQSRRRLEFFVLLVLGYLIWIALAMAVKADFLVFPKYILDPGIGLHPDRARGPFLQAEANGATLNILGLIALDAYGRGRLHGFWAVLVLGTLPLALLATKTRAVWLGFGLSTLALWFLTRSSKVRRVCGAMAIAGAVFLLAALTLSSSRDGSVRERMTNSNTVEFRFAAYQAGWQMLQERPLLGWGAGPMQVELADRIDGFHGEVFVVHNTYLEIVLEYGLIGFALYVWIVVEFIRLTRRAHTPGFGTRGEFLEEPRPVWPLVLGVYFLSGMFVVMSYQFVNGLLFTLAGALAGQAGRDRAFEGV